MKCDKLKPYTYDDMIDGDADTNIEYYPKSDADAIIAHKDFEIDRLKEFNAFLKQRISNGDVGCSIFLDDLEQKDKEIADLKQKLEDVQASAYAESVDSGMRERRLKRALWLARAMCAQESQYWGAYVRYVHLHENSFYEFINDDIFHRDNPNNDSFRMWSNRWRSVERKCLAKAEEYK